jgi:hypothetical protein
MRALTLVAGCESLKRHGVGKREGELLPRESRHKKFVDEFPKSKKYGLVSSSYTR